MRITTTSTTQEQNKDRKPTRNRIRSSARNVSPHATCDDNGMTYRRYSSSPSYHSNANVSKSIII